MLFLSSCKDNPVIPKKTNTINIFDTARFNWHVDVLVLGGIGYQDYTPDSSNLYILGSTTFLHYHDKIYETHYFNLPNGFNADAIGGLDNSNIFFGGTIYNGLQGEYAKLKFLKWNGASIQEISINDSSIIPDYFNSIYVRNLNDIWIGLYRGRIINYNGSTFTYYSIDSNYSFRTIFEQDNDLYCVADYNPVYPDTLSIFKFETNSWSKVYSCYNVSRIKFTLSFIGEHLFGTMTQSIGQTLYSFNGTTFIKVMDINQFTKSQYETFGGPNLNDVLMHGWAPDNGDTTFDILNWNGNKWSREVKNFYGILYYVKGFGNKYFCVSVSDLTSYVLIGTRK